MKGFTAKKILSRVSGLALSAAVLIPMTALTLFPSAVQAGGGGGITGATELTQLANNAELVAVLGKEAENLAYTIKQYQGMAKDWEKLPDFIKSSAAGDLAQLAKVVDYGQALAYSSAGMEGDFNGVFKGFDYYKNLSGTNAKDTKLQKYVDWAKTTQDSVLGALKSANMQSGQFSNETASLNAIKEQMANAQGANQILQAGGQIAGAQVEQLQKLRELQMASMQMQGAAIAADTDRKAAEDAGLDRSKQKGKMTAGGGDGVTQTYKFGN